MRAKQELNREEEESLYFPVKAPNKTRPLNLLRSRKSRVLSGALIFLLWPLMLLLIPLWILAWIFIIVISDSGPIGKLLKRFTWTRMLLWQIGHFAWYGNIEWNYTAFNRRKWLAHSHPTGTDTTRADMLTDLLYYLDEGMSTERILYLLGEPDSRRPVDNYHVRDEITDRIKTLPGVRKYLYRIGKDRIGYMGNLGIDFDANGKMLSAGGALGDEEERER